LKPARAAAQFPSRRANRSNGCGLPGATRMDTIVRRPLKRTGLMDLRDGMRPELANRKTRHERHLRAYEDRRSSSAHLMSAGSEEAFLGKGKAPGMKSNPAIVAADRHNGEPNCRYSQAEGRRRKWRRT